MAVIAFTFLPLPLGAGTLDLQEADVATDTTVDLSGHWRWVPDAFVPPLQMITREDVQTVYVPHHWPGEGFGTYHVTVVLREAGQYMLHIPPQRSAWELYTRGELVARAGSIGRSRESSVPDYGDRLVPIEVPPREPDGIPVLDLVFHVSNFHADTGGLVHRIFLGPVTVLGPRVEFERMVNHWLIGVLFILAIYHVIIFIGQHHQREYLYFAGMTFFFGAYLLVWSLFRFAPNPAGWRILVTVGHVTPTLALAALWLYLARLFPGDFPKQLTGVVVGSAVLLILGIILTPIPHRTVIHQTANTYLGIAVLVSLGCTGIAAYRRREFAVSFLGAVGVIGVTAVNDILLAQRRIESVELTQYGFVLFIFAQAVTLSVRFWRSFTRVQQLSRDLELRNVELSDTNEAYAHFVPVQFLQHLNRHKITDVELGDQTARSMSILFSDIRDFTTHSERMTPRDNFRFLNSYLGRIGPLIRENHGFIDKYIGDAIMALFDRSADDALNAALAMEREIIVYNQHRASVDYPPIMNGVGVHFGPLMLGIIGEENRMESTVISDAVNTASRIEGLTKVYDTAILTSRDTIDQLNEGERFCFRSVDLVTVKGRSTPVELFEVLDPDYFPRDAVKHHESTRLTEAVTAFRSGDWTRANTIIGEMVEASPSDGVYRVYKERLERFRTHGYPDPESWQGAVVLDHK